MADADTCMRCGKTPEEIPEYVDMASGTGLTPSQWMRQEEGTYNPESGHFACTACYIALGQPVGEGGRRWRAP